VTEAQPQLTTFGALIRFAASLEEEAARQYETWAVGLASERASALGTLAASHRRRAGQLTRMVQEQLNEMILEPISGLRAGDYTAGSGLGEATGDVVAVAVQLERRLVRLYHDMVERAGRALGNATRTLARFGEQSRLAAEALKR
jgi:hypothetical protein